MATAAVAAAKIQVTPNSSMCCFECTAPKVKYYSVDHGAFHVAHCGESCIDPKDYKEYHLFEHNLTLATDDHPCSKQFTPDGGFYSNYTGTETHGFPGILQVTVDMYSEPK